MADNILRLKVESSEYDAKLKKAAEGIRHLAEVAHRGGGELTGLEKAELDYVKALGSMETKSRTASGSVRELESTFKELTVVYNHLNDVEKQDEGGKALRASLDQIKQRAQEARAELDEASKSLQGAGNIMKDVGDGNSGLTSMLAVFGGNLLTKGVSMLTSELVGSVQQSIELAQQGEGIRMAFDRLNQPDLLNNLKEATHGTVSELELMKAAIKFENFKLPLEDLGTYLAFAQQKAQDTGDSVDNMVTSIVNGLGRQSVQILDNLGISASEIRNRMKEGGDMTQVVAQIIREEMTKAGDYVETAATRAARATAKAQDAAEAFGRNAIPIAQEWAETWATLSQGAMTFANTLLGPVAKSIRSIQGILNGDQSFEARLERAMQKQEEENRKAQNNRKPTWGDVPVVTAPGGYVEITDKNGKVISGKHFDDLSGVDAWKAGLSIKSTRSGGSRGRNKQSTADMLWSTFNKETRKFDAALLKEQTTSGPSDIFRLMQAQHNASLPTVATQGEKDAFEKRRKEVKNERESDEKKKDKDAVEVADQIYGGVTSMVSSLEQMGIELPEGFKSMVGAIGGVIGVLQSIMMIVNAIQAVQEVGTFLGLFKNGGIVPHAQNGINVVGGTHYSGDVTPILANAGEVVLNRSQVSNLASALQGSGMQNMKLEATVSGEQLRFVLNNNGRRTGRGEYVQSTKRS